MLNKAIFRQFRDLRILRFLTSSPIRSFSGATNTVSRVNEIKVNQEKDAATKNDLLDTFGRKHDYLRISLTERCNLRCLYCMPEDGVQLTPNDKLLSSDEIIRLAKLFVTRFGVRKIRLTGGEPLIRADIVDIVKRLNALKCEDGLQKIGITTNGIVFDRHCAALRAAGLDSVNISLDTLRADRFERITRRRGLRLVLRSIETALRTDFDAVKINFVPMKAVNDDEIEDFVQLTADYRLEVRFIEYMPFDGNRWKLEKMINFRDLLAQLRVRFPDLRQLPPPSLNETALCYRVDGFIGTIGFIASMTNAFCGSCNRIRLTADGNLKVCLFGKEEISLKDAMRNGQDDEQLAGMIIDAVRRKKKQHAGAINIAKNQNRPMILIGGSSNWSGSRVSSIRYFSNNSTSSSNSPNLTHIDAKSGHARMVDISEKLITVRVARAIATIHLDLAIIDAIESNRITKGDVFSVAKIAAVMATKKTGELIPLCHTIPLDQIEIRFEIDRQNCNVMIESEIIATYKTGVEMEALTAVSVAALTIYDMCKSMSKKITIRDIHLVAKSGGKSNFNHE